MASDREIIHAIRLSMVGQRTEALLLLRTLTQTAPDDFRPWWALAHLSRSLAERREALQRVLLLKPEQEEALELLAKLERKTRHRAS